MAIEALSEETESNRYADPTEHGASPRPNHPLVSFTSRTSDEARTRSQIEQVLPPNMDVAADSVLQPMKAISFPLGEICGGPILPEVSGNTPVGRITETNNGESSAGRVA